MGSRPRFRILMLLGYAPGFGRTFSKSAALIGDVVKLREVESLSGDSEPGLPYLHRVSSSEYELLIPRYRPQTVWHNPRHPIYGGRFQRALSYLEARHGRIDVIHGHFYSSVINALRAERPVVVTEHSSVFGRSAEASRSVRRSIRTARAVYGRTSITLPVSDHQMTLMRNAGADGRMQVVHNPVAPFDAPITPRERSRTPIRLLTACRLAPTKNLDAGVEAVARLRRSGLSLSWTVLGQGSEREALQTLTSTLGFTDSVSFRGQVDPSDVGREMSAADVYLMSSTVESFALPVIEAIISGLPVVATPVGVAPELSGLRSLSLTAGFESVDIAEAINRLINDYPSVEERIEESRAIRSLFSLEATAERLFEVYLSVT